MEEYTSSTIKQLSFSGLASWLDTAFAAGAMIFVVVEEVIPESQQNGNGDLATTGTILGFALMMFLDVAFGK